MSETPKVGDRVRVTYVYEGKVDEAHESGAFHLKNGENYRGESYHGNGTDMPDGAIRSIEILERAKSKWQDGDVALSMKFFSPSATQNVRVLIAGKWVYPPTGEVQNPHESASDHAARYNYKLIVRDGAAVQ